MDTTRGYDDLEVFCEMLRRYPPRRGFVKRINLFMGYATDSEIAYSYWLDNWERSCARWSRLLTDIPTLPACTILNLTASHVSLLQLWLPKLPNLSLLRFREQDVEEEPVTMVMIPPTSPNRLQKLDFSVDGDIHCDLLDDCLSASASSLRCLEVDVNDDDDDLCRKVKDILMRHEQSLRSLVAMTLTRECYTGDDTFSALRELGYVHGSEYDDMASIIPRRRALVSLKPPDEPVYPYPKCSSPHAEALPPSLCEAISYASSLTCIQIAPVTWTIHSFDNEAHGQLLHVHILDPCLEPTSRDIIDYRARNVPAAIAELAYKRSGLDYHAMQEGVRGGRLSKAAWDLLDEWVDSTDPAMDVTSCSSCEEP